ncbi:MAG: hypothetical protein D6780_01585 [Candidatus Dadabacteria bacterium]|nr:MAG: hypothetical protein D6780_01585 [Candidatus Dadabacteria bacterium]
MKKVFSLLFFFFFLISSKALLAENKKRDVPKIAVEIRTVLGKEDGIKQRDIQLDSRLNDLKGKLEKFPYTYYALIARQRAVLPVMKKSVFNVGKGYSLLLRPLYLDLKEKKVGVWLRWLDEKGHYLLDTKMHLALSEPLVSGTRYKDNKGILLAISIKPYLK